MPRNPASCCSASRVPARARRRRASPSTTTSRTSRPATCSARRRRRAPRSASRPSGTWTRASSFPTRSWSASSRSASPPGGPLDDGFVLDGFPRTLQQAERARPGARRPARSTSSINLDVPREIVLDRIAGRRVCENCQRVYHVNMPPTSTGRATRAAATSCSATTTPRRRSSAGSSSTSARPCRSSTTTASRSLLEVVDGVGDGDEVFERLVDDDRGPDRREHVP